MSIATLVLILHFTAVTLVIVRVILRPHREPEARIAWIAVIGFLPFLGLIVYLLFGEVDVGRKHVAKMREVLASLPEMALSAPEEAGNYQAKVSPRYQNIFNLGKAISGFDPVGANSARLMAGSNEMIDELVLDIDAAKDHVHVLFYIWLPDNNGRKVVEALKRAARRGVQCRAMVDNLGSRALIKSDCWRALEASGVQLAILLPMFTKLSGRVDLRNHRKIVVIDDSITYCGSQNCADPEFLPKASFAPWVDAVLRLEGPVARQNQHLFVSDWMASKNETISDLLTPAVAAPKAGFAAQVFGTGPTKRPMAMPQMFVAFIASAQKELTITTPYFVPNESIQSALQAASLRGVKTTLVLPKRNDSWIVQGASRSYYLDLLEAGVQIYEYEKGLLHTKSVTVDGGLTLIGSANMDRRSFDLNYENNMIIQDRQVVADIMARQQEYIANSRQVAVETVVSWSMTRRVLDNTLAVLGPIL